MSSAPPLDESSRPGVFWRWLAALAILGNIGLNYYANSRPFNGQTMGEVSAKYTTPLTPAAYAFSIWGIIFLGLVVYAVWQLLPAQRANPLPDAVAKPLTVANVATAAWVILFAHELLLATVGTMLVILGALILTYGRARGLIRSAHAAPRWVGIPFALFLGWISVATVLNITIGLRAAGINLAGDIVEKLVYLLLAVIIGLMLLLARVFQERTLPLVAAWALVGIWAAHISNQPTLAWTALAGAVLVVLLGLVLAQQGRQLQPWEISTAAAAALEAELAARRNEAH